MKPYRILVVFGTRPEAIKMAPVIRALHLHPELEPVVAVTAQHRDMLDRVLEHFEIRPKYDLDIMRPRQSLREVTVRALTGLEPVFERERPALTLVHGDTATTFVGSLAAYYAQTPVGHVEAGLRTYRKYEPFPEEMFRRLTDVIADLHFAPTERARANLLSEGVPPESIVVTGNTAIDALLDVVRPDFPFTRESLRRRPWERQRVVAVEVHRREHWGRKMRDICATLRRIAQERRDLRLVFSVHPNPEVADVVQTYLADIPSVDLLIPPLDYMEWANFMARCHFVITDSGGLQEEAPALGKPVLLLRETTERPEAVEAGTVWRVGTDPDAIYRAVNQLLDDAEKHRAMATAKNPYGDGRAAARTVQSLAHYFGLTPDRPDEWSWADGA